MTYTATAAGRLAGMQKWARGATHAILLIYLLYVIGAVGQDSRGAAAVAGYVILAVFALCWLAVPPPDSLGTYEQVSAARFWVPYAGIWVLFAAELPFAQVTGFVMAVFISISTVPRWGARSAPVVLGLAVAALVVPVAVPSWHDSLGDAWGSVSPVAIPVVALMTYLGHRALITTQALADTRAALAAAAGENERLRIARDLHDVLGHSLTTITVKAGLAARIEPTDHARAVQEIAEVEVLARQALSEVRATVAGYREVTLAGELAAGRELLLAAGITADLPRAVDDVDPAHRELFGWVVREGLTNIVRHARAARCSVRLAPAVIEITDDGAGQAAPAGNGLTGLRERVAAAGGSIDAGPVYPAGWRLRVCLEPVAAGGPR